MISSELKVSQQQLEITTQRLSEFVAIPSVSNPSSSYYNMATLIQGAQFVKDELDDLDFNARLLRIDNSAPYVIAERIVDVALPTLLFYAHYDVQDVEENKWNSDPFVVVARDGRLYGRGVSDDKAGIMAILTALRVIKEGGRELPVNIKILFEGEEEDGSNHMKAMLEQEARALHASAMIVFDGRNKDVETGTLSSFARGLVNLTIEVQALKQPVHSGIGCLAPDPAIAISALVASLSEPEKIPGFLDDAEPMTAEEREIYRRSSQTPESYMEEVGLIGGDLRGDPALSIYERIVETPSISAVNLNAGKPDGGCSIQDKATCTIGIRVTAGQDPLRVGDVVKKYLESQPMLWNLPRTIEVKQSCWAWKGKVTGPYSVKYFDALKENFSKIAAMPCGGSLPLLYDFQESFKALGLPEVEEVVAGIEDPDTNGHSHNESQSLSVLEKSINAIIHFIMNAAK